MTTIPFSDRWLLYTPGAGTATLDTDYPVLAAADIEVWRIRAGVAAKLTLTTDYTVSLLGNQAGCRVTLAALSLAGDAYALAGAIAVERISQYAEGQFRSGDINIDLNRIVAALQEMRRDLGKALRLPPSAAPVDFQIPYGAASKLLAISAAGGLELRDGTGTQFHVTTTEPAAGLGIDNDLALVVNAADADHAYVFVKVAGAWVKKDSLRGPAGTGNVDGPVSSTVNAVPRYVDTGGETLKDSPVAISDDGDVAGLRHIVSSGYSEVVLQAAPAAPAVGRVRLYMSAGGQLRMVDDTGSDQPVGSVGGGRTTLSATQTYYVRTDGADTNNGLVNDAGGAFLTIQRAIDVAATLDMSIYDVIIQAADGTYTGVNVLKTYLGAGSITIQGNAGTPANVLVNVTGDAFSGNFYGKYIIKDLKITASGTGIYAFGNGVVDYSNLNFGACGFHIRAEGTKVTATGAYTISGSASRHWFASGPGSKIACAGRTITLSGTPAFAAAFAQAEEQGMVRPTANTYSGAATGPRYRSDAMGLIQTNGAGASALPGNSAGSTSGGGLYL